MTEKSKADARALWAVRVLDAWAAENATWRHWRSGISAYDEKHICSLDDSRERTLKPSRGHDSADAARLSAAVAAFPDLPESVRRELGECPT